MFVKIRLFVLALLTLALSLSCALVSRSFQKAPIPASGAAPGLIVYTGVDGNIYTIDREGDHKTAVTTDANADLSSGEGRIYQTPAWAPDGRHLAFIGLSASARTNLQAILYTATAEEKDLVKAVSSLTDVPFYLFWSPDNQFVTFLSNDSAGSGLALHLASAAGDSHTILSTGQPLYWDWAPDSTTIFTHIGGAAADNPAARLSFLSVNGADKGKELELKPGYFQAPAWSPGGEELLLVEGKDASHEALVLAGRDGGVKRVLVPLNGPAAFAWSPDGARVAYAITTPGDNSGLFSRLLLLDPAHPADPIEIVRDIVVGFYWSPDSRKIAYFVPDLEKPNGVSLRSQKVAVLVQVYDLDSGKTSQAASFAPTDAFLQLLPFFDQYQRSGTIWSPDSKQLVLSAVENGSPRIVVVDVDGGEAHPIADGDLAFWSWK